MLEQLLESLEPLSHAQRVRAILALAKQADGADLMAQLAQGEPYERYLAVYSIYATGDQALVRQFLHDDSRLVRSKALSFAVKLLPDAELSALLEQVSAQTQMLLVRGLHKQKQLAVIDAWLAHCEPLQQLRYLPFASAQLLNRLDPTLFERASVEDWRRLAANHSQFVLDWFSGYLEYNSLFEEDFLNTLNAVLVKLSEHRPDLALPLFTAAIQHFAPHELHFTQLMRYFPDQVAALLPSSIPQNFTYTLRNFAHLLSPEVLDSWLEQEWLAADLVWFKRIPAAVRAQLFERHQVAWRNDNAWIQPEIVGLLPTDLRQAEARRSIALPSLQLNDAQTLKYVSFLPWDEALEQSRDLFSAPDVDLRGAALKALIGVGRYEDRQAEILALVEQRKNEADPVRQAMIEGLADLPPRVWLTTHLPALERIFRAALQAGDCSEQTIRQIERLILRIFPFHEDWAAQQLTSIVQSQTKLQTYPLWSLLNASQVAKLVALFQPTLEEWHQNGANRNVVQIAAHFYRRLAAAPQLVALLERIAHDTEIYSAQQAVQILARDKRAYLATLAPALVQADASWLYVPEISYYLEKHNPHLFSIALPQVNSGGKFSGWRDLQAISLHGLFARWTEKQQAALANHLDRLLIRTEHSDQVQSELIRLHSSLYALPPNRLMILAEPASDPEEPVRTTRYREAALRALARFDSLQTLPFLIEALGDARARIAIYALRSQLLTIDKQQALEYLKQAPTQKITVAKEVVRLIGELGTDEAYAELLRFNALDLHRDVRWALNRALWKYLDREQTWQILQQSMDSGDLVLINSVLSFDLSRAGSAHKQRYQGFFVQALQHSEPKIRLAALNRLQQFSLGEEYAALYPLIARELASPYPQLRDAVLRLVFGTSNRSPDALIRQSTEFVLLDWRCILGMMRWLSLDYSHSAEYSAILRPYFANDPLFAQIYAQLAFYSRDAELYRQLIEELLAKEWLHGDIVHEQSKQLEVSAWRPLKGQEALQAQWSVHPDPRLRRLAFAIWSVRRGRQGWDEEIIAQHQQFCQDPAPLVASAALDILPPDQEPSEQDAES